MNRKSNGRINRDSMARHRKHMKWVHHELDIFKDDLSIVFVKSTWENFGNSFYVSPSDLLSRYELGEIVSNVPKSYDDAPMANNGRCSNDKK